MPTSITFLGGAGTVTGSSHLITHERAQVLLDVGLFQGSRDEFYRINTTFHYNPHKLNALVLSHAHIDHCGNLPSLIARGGRCRVYATEATRDLCKLMLEDSGKIQEEDIRYVNKINRRLGLPPRKPLYTRKDAVQATKRIRPLAYEKKFCVARDVFVTLYDSGHVLGSAVVVVDLKNERGTVRVGYAVDLGRKNLPLLNDPVAPPGLDYLILESTYGARLHAPIEEAKQKLKDAINRTVARGGKILIPSFTLERTQELVYFLNELLRAKAIPSIPVYIDSPLAVDITEVFRFHGACLNERTRQAIAAGQSPFESLNIHYIREQSDSKRLNIDKRPMIIIAGSGMCESGRILHHLKNNLAESRNTILVVGYMAKDTLGKKIVERSRIVRIFGVEYELNAEVTVINSFSGHADRNELMEYVSACAPLKKVFIVHGDPEQSHFLCDTLLAGGVNAAVPSKDEEAFLN